MSSQTTIGSMLERLSKGGPQNAPVVPDAAQKTPAGLFRVKAKLSDGTIFEDLFDHQPTQDEVMLAIQKRRNPPPSDAPQMKPAQDTGIIGGIQNWLAETGSDFRDRRGREGYTPIGAAIDSLVHGAAQSTGIGEQATEGPGVGQLIGGGAEMAIPAAIAPALALSPLPTAAALGVGTAADYLARKGAGAVAKEFAPGSEDLVSEILGNIAMLAGASAGHKGVSRFRPEAQPVPRRDPGMRTREILHGSRRAGTGAVEGEPAWFRKAHAAGTGTAVVPTDKEIRAAIAQAEAMAASGGDATGAGPGVKGKPGPYGKIARDMAQEELIRGAVGLVAKGGLKSRVAFPLIRGAVKAGKAAGKRGVFDKLLGKIGVQRIPPEASPLAPPANTGLIPTAVDIPTVMRPGVSAMSGTMGRIAEPPMQNLMPGGGPMPGMVLIDGVEVPETVLAAYRQVMKGMPEDQILTAAKTAAMNIRQAIDPTATPSAAAHSGPPSAPPTSGMLPSEEKAVLDMVSRPPSDMTERFTPMQVPGTGVIDPSMMADRFQPMMAPGAGPISPDAMADRFKPMRPALREHADRMPTIEGMPGDQSHPGVQARLAWREQGARIADNMSTEELINALSIKNRERWDYGESIGGRVEGKDTAPDFAAQALIRRGITKNPKFAPPKPGAAPPPGGAPPVQGGPGAPPPSTAGAPPTPAAPPTAPAPPSAPPATVAAPVIPVAAPPPAPPAPVAPGAALETPVGRSIAEQFAALMSSETPDVPDPMAMLRTEMAPTGRMVLPVVDTKPLKLQPIESSKFKAWAYSPKRMVLDVQRNDGKIYRYHNVMPEEVDAVMGAKPRGQHAEGDATRGQLLGKLLDRHPATRIAGGEGVSGEPEAPAKAEKPPNPRAVLTNARPGKPATAPEDVMSELQATIAAFEGKKAPGTAPVQAEAAPETPVGTTQGAERPVTAPPVAATPTEARGTPRTAPTEAPGTSPDVKTLQERARATATAPPDATARVDGKMVHVGEEVSGGRVVMDITDGVPELSPLRKPLREVGKSYSEAESAAQAAKGPAGGGSTRSPKGPEATGPRPGTPPPGTDLKPSEAPKFSVEPNELGLYSQLERVVADTKQGKQKGGDWINFLRDPKRAVTADEMKWSGLDDYLAQRKGETVTRDEISQFLKENNVKVVQDRYKGQRRLSDLKIAPEIAALKKDGFVVEEEDGKILFSDLETNPDRGDMDDAHGLALMATRARRDLLPDAPLMTRVAKHAAAVEKFYYGPTVEPSLTDQVARPLVQTLKKAGFGLIEVEDEDATGMLLGYTDIKSGDLFTDAGELAEHYAGSRTSPRIQAAIEAAKKLDEYWASAKATKGSKPTKFSKYMIPGGTNYQELLIQVPSKTSAFTLEHRAVNNSWDVYGPNGDFWGSLSGKLTEAEARAAVPSHFNMARKGSYFEEHWDTNDTVASVRLSDRTSMEGKKVLLDEETQSDWSQQGRRHGFVKDKAVYQDEVAQEMYQKRFNVLDDVDKQTVLDEIEERGTQGGGAGGFHPRRQKVAHGPYVEDTAKWTELSLKVLLRKAVEGGYDQLAWAPGSVHTARWGTERIAWKKLGGPTKEGASFAAWMDWAKKNGYHDDLAKAVWETGKTEKPPAGHPLRKFMDMIDNGKVDLSKYGYQQGGIQGDTIKEAVKRDAFIDWAKTRRGMTAKEARQAFNSDAPWTERLLQAWGDFTKALDAGKIDLGPYQPKDVWMVDAQKQTGGLAGGVDLEGEATSHGLNPQNSAAVASVEDLARVIEPSLTEGQHSGKIAAKIWARMQNEPEGVSMPRKEGFEEYYDKTFMPNAARKLAKKLGGTIGEATIKRPSTTDENAIFLRADEYGGVEGVRKAALTHMKEGSEVYGVDKHGQETMITDPAEVADYEAFALGDMPPLKVMAINITPEMRASVMKGMPQFKVGAGEKAGPITLESVRANLPKEIVGKVVEKNGEFHIDTGRGRIVILPKGEIRFDWPAMERGLEAHGPDAVEGFKAGAKKIVGSSQTIKGEHIVQIVEAGALPHEVPGHVYYEHFATPKEKVFIEKELGAEAKRSGQTIDEAWSNWYSDWFKNRREEAPKNAIDAVFRRIYDFFEGIYRTFKPTLESTAKGVGKAFDRPPVAEGRAPALVDAPSFGKKNVQITPPERIKNFKSWFGKSKVKDTDGTPKILYHGTTKPGFTKPDTPLFLTDQPERASWYADPFGTTESPFGGDVHGGVYPVYVKMDRPIDLRTRAGKSTLKGIVTGLGEEWIEAGSAGTPASSFAYDPKIRKALVAAGYDGMIADQTFVGSNAKCNEYIAFNPAQIKSATGNAGTFSPKSSDIRFSVGPTSRPPKMPGGETGRMLKQASVTRHARRAQHGVIDKPADMMPRIAPREGEAPTPLTEVPGRKAWVLDRIGSVKKELDGMYATSYSTTTGIGHGNRTLSEGQWKRLSELQREWKKLETERKKMGW